LGSKTFLGGSEPVPLLAKERRKPVEMKTRQLINEMWFNAIASTF
jgi:hypothetical protein